MHKPKPISLNIFVSQPGIDTLKS